MRVETGNPAISHIIRRGQFPRLVRAALNFGCGSQAALLLLNWHWMVGRNTSLSHEKTQCIDCQRHSWHSITQYLSGREWIFSYICPDIGVVFGWLFIHSQAKDISWSNIIFREWNAWPEYVVDLRTNLPNFVEGTIPETGGSYLNEVVPHDPNVNGQHTPTPAWNSQQSRFCQPTG